MKQVLTTTAGAVTMCRTISAENLSEYLSQAMSIQHILTLTTDRDFIRSLEDCNSFLQQTLFQVLVQDSLDHLTQNSSNFRLKSLKDDFRKTMSNSLSPTEEEFL